jgi:hypothetical protein
VPALLNRPIDWKPEIGHACLAERAKRVTKELTRSSGHLKSGHASNKDESASQRLLRRAGSGRESSGSNCPGFELTAPICEGGRP